MLKVKIDKKKKLNPWDRDNSIESKLKKNYETQFPNNLMLKDEIKKKKLTKKIKVDWVVGRWNWKKKIQL